MTKKPKRNREYVIVAAAVLGLGASACCQRDSAGGASPKASANRAQQKPAPAHPPGGRMGTPR